MKKVIMFLMFIFCICCSLQTTAQDDIQNALEGKSSTYQTERGITVNRVLLDFLMDGNLVPFHLIKKNGSMFIFFDNGHDLNDQEIRKAMNTWETIESEDFTIFVDPQLEDIQQIPGESDFALIRGRVFVKGTVKYIPRTVGPY